MAQQDAVGAAVSLAIIGAIGVLGYKNWPTVKKAFGAKQSPMPGQTSATQDIVQSLGITTEALKRAFAAQDKAGYPYNVITEMPDGTITAAIPTQSQVDSFISSGGLGDAYDE